MQCSARTCSMRCWSGGPHCLEVGPGAAQQGYTLHRVRDTKNLPFVLDAERAQYAAYLAGFEEKGAGR